MNIKRILEHRHEIEVAWDEPHRAYSVSGEEVPAYVTVRATVHDCINMARLRAVINKEKGYKCPETDAELLDDFIITHWARVEGYRKRVPTPREWFTTPNPLLGDISPIDMIRLGRGAKLINWIEQQIGENNEQGD